MQPSFDIATIAAAGHIRLVLAGELDIATAPRLEAALDEARGQGPAEILIDLADVPFIDSSGLRSLIAAVERADANGGRLSIAGAGPQALRLFELSGAETRLPLV